MGHYNSPFVTDKRGQTVFFPWLGRGKGYIVPNAETLRKLNILSLGYQWGLIILPFLVFFLSFLSLSTRGGYLLCIGVFIGVPVNLFVLYFLIEEAAMKKLAVYPLSYKELILDNLSSDEDDSVI